MSTGAPTCLDALNEYMEKAKRRYAEAASVENAHRRSSSIGQTIWEGASYARSEVGMNADLDEAWQSIAEIFHEGEIVKGIVTGWNRGGLLVRWERLQGFVPASQLKMIPCAEDPADRDEELAHWVGEELDLKVIELDRSRNRLVFSERATIWGPKDGLRLLESIAPGEIQQGVVSNVCEFGAFVDLGGVDGLIHVSELSWGRVSHPSEILQIGQPVTVYVISVDRANRRVALSLKRLRPDPWTIVDQEYYVGQVLDAVVTNVVDFGAFARIGEGLEGLVHISEFPEERKAGFTRATEMIEPGETVSVCIVRIDSANHRLGLSMRLPGDDAPASDEEPATYDDAGSAPADHNNLIF